jgi:hypothetical protein
VAIENKKAKTQKAQQVINRLSERWYQGRDEPFPECKLGREPRTRRGGKCSACTTKAEFEVDKEVSRLIDRGTFDRPLACPYRVVTNLLCAMTIGPEAARARGGKLDRVDPVRELKTIIRRVGMFIRATTTFSREDIEALIDDENEWRPHKLIVSAERNLREALTLLEQLNAKPRTRSRGGRIGNLDIQAVARAMAIAWRELTGSLPAKENLSFRSLLRAATLTVLGDLPREPNWEAATQTARQRIRRMIGRPGANARKVSSY